jgi:hypothetical protein
MVQPRSGRPDAATVIWNWRDEESHREPERAGSRVRIRGALQALVGIALGALVFTYGSRTIGSVILVIGTTILLSALLSPQGLFRAIETVFQAFGRAVGRVITGVTMLAVFYLFFLPFGLLFRRGKRDPMRRFYEADATSYWEARKIARSASASHERQY